MSTFFICGATGLQGGAVTRALLDINPKHTIQALARDPTSAKAQALVELGVRITPGGFDDVEALRTAIKGSYAVFMNFMPDFTDWGANLRQAKNILSIAKEEGVKHIVYSSGVGVDKFHDDNSVDHESPVGQVMASKWDIEQAVKESDLSWTILRPGNFYANYINPFAAMQLNGLAETGVWTTALRASDKLPCIDTTTIGSFTAQALLNPKSFSGQTISYADELYSIGEIVDKLAKKSGRDLKMVTMSEADIDQQKNVNPFIGGQLCMRKMEGWFDGREGEKWLQEWGVEKVTFDEFLDRESDGVKVTFPQK